MWENTHTVKRDRTPWKHRNPRRIPGNLLKHRNPDESFASIDFSWDQRNAVLSYRTCLKKMNSVRTTIFYRIRKTIWKCRLLRTWKPCVETGTFFWCKNLYNERLYSNSWSLWQEENAWPYNKREATCEHFLLVT